MEVVSGAGEGRCGKCGYRLDGACVQVEKAVVWGSYYFTDIEVEAVERVLEGMRRRAVEKWGWRKKTGRRGVGESRVRVCVDV